MSKIRKVPLESNMNINDFASVNCKVTFESPALLIKQMYRVIDFQGWHICNLLKMKREKVIRLETDSKAKTKDLEKEKERNTSLKSRNNKLIALLKRGEEKLSKLSNKNKTQLTENSKNKCASA